MTVTNPWVAVGIATVPPLVTAIVALARSAVVSTTRKRKNVLADMDFIARLHAYEAANDVRFAPDVLSRSHADLARHVRLYVDRNSWQWFVSFPLVYGSFINMFGYLLASLIKLLAWVADFHPSPDDLPSLQLVITVSSVVVVIWASSVGAMFMGARTWAESVEAFEGREGHLVPVRGPGLTRPLMRRRREPKGGETKGGDEGTCLRK